MEIIKFLITSGLMTAALVYIAKHLIDLLFSRSAEKFKHDLQREAEKDAIRFKGLHAKRANIIDDIYKKLVETYTSFSSLMNPWQAIGELPEDAKRKIAMAHFNDFSNHFQLNKIYFTKDTADKIEGFILELRRLWNEFHTPKYNEHGTQYRDVDAWSKVWDYTREEIPKLREQIEKDFRDILGAN